MNSNIISDINKSISKFRAMQADRRYPTEITLGKYETIELDKHIENLYFLKDSNIKEINEFMGMKIKKSELNTIISVK